jgi:transposase
MEETVKKKFEALDGELDERLRRLWAAVEADALGYGGVSAVARATGISWKTIHSGRRELKQKKKASPGDRQRRRVRRSGGGRKKLTEHEPGLLKALDALVEPTSRGDPMSPLRWTCKSTRKLAEALNKQGYQVSHTTVATLLGELGYSLQGMRKARDGSSHPDRNGQFEYMNQQVKDFQRAGQPVISVDCKKKELVGDYANSGREYQPKGQPVPAPVHDFIDKELGKVIPYGVYDVSSNVGWVSVGVDHETPAFAVETIRQWWMRMGSRRYPDAGQILITPDAGGANGYRRRLWKVELGRLAERTGLEVHVCHFPPGTSKWNKIEHRMFSHITENWRGRPLASREVIVNLIANTTTRKGLRIKAGLDKRKYPTKIKVTDEQMKALNLVHDEYHGDWNYMIAPEE